MPNEYHTPNGNETRIVTATTSDGLTFPKLTLGNDTGRAELRNRLNANTSIRHGLLGFWKFDESFSYGNVPTIRLDSISDANFTANGDVGQLEESTITLAGNNSTYLTTNSFIRFTNSTNPTLVCRFKADTWPAALKYCQVFEFASWNGSVFVPNLSVGMYNPFSQALMARYRNTSSVKDITGAGAGSTGTWYHLVISWDYDNKLYFYINNSLNSITTSASDMYPYNSSLTYVLNIGRYTTLNASPFDGSVDYCGFWNRPLNATEVSYLYNNGESIV